MVKMNYIIYILGNFTMRFYFDVRKRFGYNNRMVSSKNVFFPGEITYLGFVQKLTC